MLLDYNVMADRESQASAFSGRLGCKKRIKHFFTYIISEPRSVIPNPDFDART